MTSHFRPASVLTGAGRPIVPSTAAVGDCAYFILTPRLQVFAKRNNNWNRRGAKSAKDREGAGLFQTAFFANLRVLRVFAVDVVVPSTAIGTAKAPRARRTAE
jgi:hypothetical protein